MTEFLSRFGKDGHRHGNSKSRPLKRGSEELARSLVKESLPRDINGPVNIDEATCLDLLLFYGGLQNNPAVLDWLVLVCFTN